MYARICRFFAYFNLSNRVSDNYETFRKLEFSSIKLISRKEEHSGYEL